MIGRARSQPFALAAIAAITALAGCSYQDPETTAPYVLNTCTPDTLCGQDAECREGMCVARRADVPLSIVLQVTPVRTPDGREPQPIILERFDVNGPIDRTFELPMPVEITGYVRKEQLPIEATVTFTPVNLARGLPISKVMTATSVTAPDAVETADYVVRLLPGFEYRMAVLPKDTALPPQYRTFVAEEPEELRVEYGPAAEAVTRTYRIAGGPSDRPLIVRAFDRTTSELISSTAPVVDGMAVLRFAGEPDPFRLEVQAEESYDGEQPDPNAEWCDTSTPVFPKFTFDPDELVTATGTDGIVRLPAQPTRIRFEGTVALCSAAEQARATAADMDVATALPVDSLPITLHSQRLLDNDGLPLAAQFDATTMATRSDQSGELRFCVQVMPGEYDVRATPAPSVPCSLFAEHFLISAPEGGNASGPLLQLPPVAYLKGTVQKLDLSPLSQAVVDAVALGRSAGIDLEASDRSVVRYNRSRQTSTGTQGEFELPVDLGSYDVLFKPPSGTGFSWQVRHDVAIGKRDVDFRTVIDMQSPVVVNGKLSYRGGQISLQGAEIAAFAVVEDEFDTERAIQVGRATADDSGEFMLLLPASLQKGW